MVVEGMAQRANYLPHQCEDWSSHPQDPCKSWAAVAATHNPVFRRPKQAFTRQSGHQLELTSSELSERICLKE